MKFAVLLGRLLELTETDSIFAKILLLQRNQHFYLDVNSP